MADTSNDPLAIFSSEPASNAAPSGSSPAGGSVNLFDPLGGSQPSGKADKNATAPPADPLDLMSQISSWGATNNHATDAESSQPAAQEDKAEESEPKFNASVMATKKNAIDLSDDLVAEAHREFEATEKQLKIFEEKMGPEAQ
jgi:hypothetical protein